MDELDMSHNHGGDDMDNGYRGGYDEVDMGHHYSVGEERIWMIVLAEDLRTWIRVITM
jgi:hypothetical protein